MSQLFTPLQVGPLKLANRIIIAPMCQYMADEGLATDWHTIHLGQMALSGAGMLIIEATAVEAGLRVVAAVNSVEGVDQDLAEAVRVQVDRVGGRDQTRRAREAGEQGRRQTILFHHNTPN